MLRQSPPRSYSPVFPDSRYRDPYAVAVRHTATVQVERFRSQELAGKFQDELSANGYELFDARSADDMDLTEVPRYIKVRVSETGILVIDTHNSGVVQQYPDTPYNRRKAGRYLDHLNEQAS